LFCINEGKNCTDSCLCGTKCSNRRRVHIDWSQCVSGCPENLPDDFPKEAKHLPEANIPEGVSSELDFINLFIPNFVIQLVEKDSNEYVKKSKDKWKTPPLNLNIALIRQYIITAIYMSFVKAPNIAFHFSRSHTMSESTYLSDIGMTYSKFFCYIQSFAYELGILREHNELFIQEISYSFHHYVY
jgi:hypothetical protein